MWHYWRLQEFYVYRGLELLSGGCHAMITKVGIRQTSGIIDRSGVLYECTAIYRFRRRSLTGKCLGQRRKLGRTRFLWLPKSTVAIGHSSAICRRSSDCRETLCCD